MSDGPDVPILWPDDWVRHEVLFVKKLRGVGFSSDQILAIIMALDETCRYCRDAGPSCQCSRDE